ncbi:MAG: DNA cytosine methyltransferase [Proteobacteria bacterium]|nr:DNA cytosine methyltransferase [Pseudomonadota bacterium]MBU1741321.1 DNA cytosine methyltransferase [Pseudomonadota bacterium]
MPTFLDFFAGSGLVCEGLKGYFNTVWANDNSKKKAAVFYANHPIELFKLGPIEKIRGRDLPKATLSWGSFPCQDLSLAGNMNGISSPRSGLVWHWLRVMDEMKQKPPIAVAENVVGLISASGGLHYRSLHNALVKRGYFVGAVLLDASYWVPQSRKRVFVIAAQREIINKELESKVPLWCHSASIKKAAKGLNNWIWWRLPEPSSSPRKTLEDVIDFNAACDDEEKTKYLISLIPEKHRKKMEEERRKGQTVFPGYKRIRHGRQVLELRFDGIAGCLRTPEGGSSRQYLVISHKGSIKTRLLTVKETAALMGVRKGYNIPGSYNDGYRAMGDAVAVPVTRYLARHILVPLAENALEYDK